jgi:ABC-type uncharacterized transport system permease subunit
MTAMMVTVGLFTVINYALKAAGPVLMPDRTFPRWVQLVVDALPLALLTAVVVTAVVGVRGSLLDVTVLIGLGAAATAWRLGSGHGTCVTVCVITTGLCRLLS